MDYRFPYSNEYFDQILLTSVFTHMFHEDVESYIHEIGRMLKKGKYAVMTFFIINAESEALIKEGKSGRLSFRIPHGNCWINNQKRPNSAVAYEEDYLRVLINSAGLNIVEPILFGSWPGRKEFKRRQDILIVTK